MAGREGGFLAVSFHDLVKMYLLLYWLLAERASSRQQHLGSAEHTVSRFYEKRAETLKLKTSAFGGGRE